MRNIDTVLKEDKILTIVKFEDILFRDFSL